MRSCTKFTMLRHRRIKLGTEDECNCGPGKIKGNRDKVPIYAVAVFIVLELVMFSAVVKHGHKIPEQLKLADEKNHPDSFIGESSQKYLKSLTDIGPRIAGSPQNEKSAISFFKNELNSIKRNANPNQLIEIDHQIVSGTFYHNRSTYGTIINYENVQNIVVRLGSSDENNNSLLLNCHFDTAPSSPGGSDDGIMCASMLETLRVLSKQTFRLAHSIIFLFNGAEEIQMSASHGFITQHRWAPECKAVINLDSAGSGEQETLFQATGGNNIILRHYVKSAPYPSAQSLAEELFEQNIIPSVSDFRVFADYGHISGVDLAFTSNGYVYHTKYDKFEKIKNGTYQHVGDNLLALVKSLASSSDLAKEFKNEGKTVYFDFFGYFMVFYSKRQACIINISMAFISISVSWKHIKSNTAGTYCRKGQLFLKLFMSALSFIAGWFFSFLFTLFTINLLNVMDITMSWYTTPVIIFGLYFCPTISLSAIFHIVNNYFYCEKEHVNLVSGIKTQIHCHVHNILWTFLLITSTFLFVRSSYLFLIPIIFHTSAFGLIDTADIVKTRRKWLVLYLFMMLIPTLFSMQICALSMSALVPLTGRSGAVPNPEFLVGITATLNCILIAAYMIPLITLFLKPLDLIMSLISIYFVTLVCISLTSIGFPYSGNADSPKPQRYWIFHTYREFHGVDSLTKRDSGYYIHNMDPHSPGTIINYLPKTAVIQPLSECNNTIFCGLPIYHSGLIRSHMRSSWVTASPPTIPTRTKLKLISNKRIFPSVIHYMFEISDPVYFGLYISSKPSGKLINWSFSSIVPEHTYMWDDRPVYFVLYGSGIEPGKPFNFWIDVESPIGSEPVIDIALGGHYKNVELSKDFQDLIKLFPNWITTQAWVANYEAWVF